MQILIKKYRREKKISLRQLAKITGISRSQLNYIESKESEYMKKLDKIAQGLNVCAKDLFAGCKNKGVFPYKCKECCNEKE